MVVFWSNCCVNYWIGINKFGKDDGCMGGIVVVDFNIKVYGMDNFFVIDVLIFFGMVIINFSVYFVIVVERVSDVIFKFFVLRV